MDTIDFTEILTRFLKYLFEGLAVGIACYFSNLKADQIIAISITAAVTFAILDMFVGSTPITFDPNSLNPLKSVPSLEPKSITKSSCFKLYFEMSDLLIIFKYSTSSFVMPVLYG